MHPVARIPFRLETDRGVLRGDVRLPPADLSGGRTERAQDRALVVCHGFKGFKDWGFFPYLCGELATRVECPVIGFNMSGSGVGPDLGTFSAPDAFARNTYSRELSDLEAVLDGVAAGRLGDAVLDPCDRIGLLGHSRGAVPVAVVGAHRPEIAALVTWAGLARPDRILDMFPADPHLPAGVRNARTGEVLPLHRDVVHDLAAHRDRLDPAAALRTGAPPLLAIHGAEDEAVPIADAETLVAAGHEAELKVIEGTGHTFDARHPFTGATPALERAIEATAVHFRAHLPKEA